MNKRPDDLEVLRLPVGQMAANSYIVFDPQSQEAIIIDPGDDGQYIIETIAKHNLTPMTIIATHGHFDHIMAACELQISYNLPFFIHKNDEFLVRRMQENAEHFLRIKIVDPPPVISGNIIEGAEISIGAQSLQVIETPGHTPGSISLYDKEGGFVIVGDLLFAEGMVGRTDHKYSSPLDLSKSIQRIVELPSDTVVYSGHGEETTVADFVQAYQKALQ